jgi:peptidoglycan/xylan/chitin deacetylase (PgdA/CDA1 family)
VRAASVIMAAGSGHEATQGVRRGPDAAIVIFHESVGADLEALPWILAALHDRGYRFVRLDALFT